MGTVEAAPKKLSFDNGGDFIRETRAEVEQYLGSRSVRLRAQARLYAKTAVAFGLTLVSYLVLMLVRPGLALELVCLVGLTCGTILTALCVQHDANHGAYFRTRRANHLLGWTTDVLLGFSSYAWRVKHNVAHHTYTNVTGYDDDVEQAPFAKLTPSQASRPWYRLQHVYLWPLYTLMVIRWQTGGDIAPLVRGRIGNSPLRMPRGWDLVGLVGGKAIFVVWAVVVPLLVYPWYGVAAAYVVVAMVASLITAVTFQLAHCVEEADFVAPEELLEDRRAWAVHEVETTVDFCQRNPFLTWVLGGLNFQIEHHLFPRVPHTHYAAIAAIVRRKCAEHGIRYTTQPSLGRALGSHFRHLRAMGRIGLAPEIEMG
jgi:linoleoyl-CoA desaturase